MEQEQSLEIYKVQPTTFKTNKQTNKGTNNSVKKEKLFSKWCWDNWSSIYTYKKVNLNLNLILYIKLYIKWIIDISRTQKTIKLLEQKKVFVIGLGEELLNITIYKRKNINKLDSFQFQISALLFTRCRTWDEYFSEQKFSHLF